MNKMDNGSLFGGGLTPGQNQFSSATTSMSSPSTTPTNIGGFTPTLMQRGNYGPPPVNTGYPGKDDFWAPGHGGKDLSGGGPMPFPPRPTPMGFEPRPRNPYESGPGPDKGPGWTLPNENQMHPLQPQPTWNQGALAQTNQQSLFHPQPIPSAGGDFNGGGGGPMPVPPTGPMGFEPRPRNPYETTGPMGFEPRPRYPYESGPGPVASDPMGSLRTKGDPRGDRFTGMPMPQGNPHGLFAPTMGPDGSNQPQAQPNPWMNTYLNSRR